MTSRNNIYIFVIFLLLYEISAYLSNDMIMPGIMKVIQSFSASDYYVAPSLTAFIFGGASLQLILGPLADHFKRRSVMLFGVGFFLIINLLMGYALTIHQFIFLRFLQGMGLCFISVVGYATLQEICDELTAVRITSTMNNITIVAPLAGPLLGVFVLAFFNWPAIFNILALSTAVAFVGLYYFMPEPPPKFREDGSQIASSPLHFILIKNNYLQLLKNPSFILRYHLHGFG